MAEVELGLSGSLKECFEAELHAVHSYTALVKHFNKALVDYQSLIERKHETNEFLDISLAQGLIHCSQALLAICEQEETESNKTQHILATVSYLINGDDSEPDFESILGFEDDALIIGAVIHAFGLKESLLQLDPSLKDVLEHPALTNKGESR